jgi:AraC-like DNA-binding protein
LKDIWQLLQKTARGIRLLGPEKSQVTAIIQQIDEQTGTRRFQSLLQILTLFAEAEKTELLSNARFTEAQEEKDGKRLNAVLQFSLNNYTRPITLNEAAAAAHLSVSAFCHYFKLHTRKPYIQFLNEIRINAACKLLSESDRNIAQISYEVGFINLSNFNRQFKKVMGCAPSVYRKKFK